MQALAARARARAALRLAQPQRGLQDQQAVGAHQLAAARGPPALPDGDHSLVRQRGAQLGRGEGARAAAELLLQPLEVQTAVVVAQELHDRRGDV